MKTFVVAIVATVVFTTGCGKGVSTPRAHAPEIEPHLQRVVAEGLKRGVDYTDVVVSLETRITDEVLTGELAECRIEGGTRTILFNRRSWDDTTDGNRDVLVAHEFGHCVLNRAHRDGYRIFPETGDQLDVSIMSHIVPDERWVTQFNEYYFDELFSITKE